MIRKQKKINNGSLMTNETQDKKLLRNENNSILWPVYAF
jgi:hypothetical protein